MTDVNDWNAQIIAEFRANDGRVGGQFEGASLLLLHTTGARSGAERINPLVYLQTDAGPTIFASAAGADQHPAWYHNLRANPEVTIELGDGSGIQTRTVRARIAEGEERERIWTEQKRLSPGFADYERKTSRQIPVVLLEPRD